MILRFQSYLLIENARACQMARWPKKVFLAPFFRSVSSRHQGVSDMIGAKKLSRAQMQLPAQNARDPLSSLALPLGADRVFHCAIRANLCKRSPRRLSRALYSTRQRFVNLPMPSISTLTTLPSPRNSGGSIALPTPDGVPVRIMSPGLSVKARER